MPRTLFGKPEFEKSFDTTYGTFTLRRPSLMLKHEMHREAARLVGGQDLDWAGALDTFVMAQITVYARTDEQIRTSSKEKPVGWPEGFRWETAYEFEFLGKLIKEFDEWLQSFRKSSQPDEGEEGGVRGGADTAVPTASAVRDAADGPAVAGDD